MTCRGFGIVSASTMNVPFTAEQGNMQRGIERKESEMNTPPPKPKWKIIDLSEHIHIDDIDDYEIWKEAIETVDVKDPAVGYVRVSKESQVDGLSLDAQEAKIAAYAKINGLSYVGNVEDAGISAKDTKGRPGFRAIQQCVKERKVRHVIFYTLDRIFRNTRDALDFADLCRKNGVAMHSITEKLDTESAIGEFYFTLRASLAQLERKLVGERVKAALDHKKKNGGRVSRHAPYGWEFKGDKLVRVLREHEAIQRARNLRASGTSYRRISQFLKEAGFLSRTGKAFAPSSIKKMVADVAENDHAEGS